MTGFATATWIFNLNASLGSMGANDKLILDVCF